MMMRKGGTNSDGGQEVEVEVELDQLERLEQLYTKQNISISLKIRSSTTNPLFTSCPSDFFRRVTSRENNQ